MECCTQNLLDFNPLPRGDVIWRGFKYRASLTVGLFQAVDYVIRKLYLDRCLAPKLNNI